MSQTNQLLQWIQQINPNFIQTQEIFNFIEGINDTILQSLKDIVEIHTSPQFTLSYQISPYFKSDDAMCLEIAWYIKGSFTPMPIGHTTVVVYTNKNPEIIGETKINAEHQFDIYRLNQIHSFISSIYRDITNTVKSIFDAIKITQQPQPAFTQQSQPAFTQQSQPAFTPSLALQSPLIPKKQAVQPQNIQVSQTANNASQGIHSTGMNQPTMLKSLQTSSQLIPQIKSQQPLRSNNSITQPQSILSNQRPAMPALSLSKPAIPQVQSNNLSRPTIPQTNPQPPMLNNPQANPQPPMLNNSNDDDFDDDEDEDIDEETVDPNAKLQVIKSIDDEMNDEEELIPPLPLLHPESLISSKTPPTSQQKKRR